MTVRTIEVVTAGLETAERIAAEARQLVEAGRQLAAKSRYSSAADFEHAHAMLAETQVLLERGEADGLGSRPTLRLGRTPQ